MVVVAVDGSELPKQSLRGHYVADLRDLKQRCCENEQYHGGNGGGARSSLHVNVT